jgi:anionic cell wall polymer biosynthesis LytR-Cps2A-Psr (LCP) family protein
MKRILIVIGVLIVIGAIAGYMMWNKPHRKAENEKGLAIAAPALHKAFSDNEKMADSLYLNKVLEVSGTIAEVKDNQDHRTTVLFQTDNPMGGVFCTMRDSGVVIEKGKSIKVKGFCSGMTLTDVSMTDCVIAQ